MNTMAMAARDGEVERAILQRTDFPELGTRTEGKVRDIYRQPTRIILITTDRHSSFDRIIAHVPGKGEVLNRTSAFWFAETADIMPNHVIDVPDPNVTVARGCEPLKIEIVMRGYLTGVTGTSIWIDPEKDLYVVILTNRVNPSRNNTRHVQLRRDVADAVQQAVLGARIVNWEAR